MRKFIIYTLALILLMSVFVSAEQIRPMSQQSLSSEGNGAYSVPSASADYSSSGSLEPEKRSEGIRPADQLDDRGVGIQVRPANQLDLPKTGNGGYVPTQGSEYSSDGNSEVKLKADLTSNTNATGTALFVLDKKNNSLSYNIEYAGLSSNETSTTINGPSNAGEDAPALLTLLLGSSKIGIVNYVQAIEKYLLQGKTYLQINSQNFLNGELRGRVISLF